MKTHHTDEHLAELAQAGDGEAEYALVNRYWDLTSIIAHTYPILHTTTDDRQMESLLALTRAIRAWRADGGAKFKTFAKRLMTRALIDLDRALSCKKRRAEQPMFSLDAPVNVGGDELDLSEVIAGPQDVHGTVERKIEAEQLIKRILKAHKFVLLALGEGWEQIEIADELGVESTRVAGLVAFSRDVACTFAEGV